MQIIGKLVTLEILQREVCHEFYKKYIADMQMEEIEYIYDFENIERYYLKRADESNRLMFSIYVQDNVIGEIQIKKIDKTTNSGTLSIVLSDDSVKGKGYGTEAEKLIIEYSFNTLNLQKVLADTTIRNERSKHILRKLGFEHLKDDEQMSYFELSRNNWL